MKLVAQFPNTCVSAVALRLQKAYGKSAQIKIVSSTESFLSVFAKSDVNQLIVKQLLRTASRFSFTISEASWCPYSVLYYLQQPINIYFEQININDIKINLNYKTINKQIILEPNPHNFVFIDFEAYINKAEPVESEFGAVRVQNNKVVAELHSTFTPNQNQIKILNLNPEIVKTVQKLTGLVHSEIKGVEAEQIEFGSIFDLFCVLGAETLKQLQMMELGVKITVYEDFEEQNNCTVIAKGIQLEKMLLKRFNSKMQVHEFSRICKKTTKDMHSVKRQFKYCEVHQALKCCNAEHCALDDARFLADTYLQDKI
ncbi:Conserved_hypothetical protein [Hexamita inflata]|uniref:Uncharacterized protein n=1 Tax=Hexamita inflata TaxID=28002 RepID=A0AA86PBD1_9EUKA|nr:Conserved hypothetical protein [Hexamita inflata]